MTAKTYDRQKIAKFLAVIGENIKAVQKFLGNAFYPPEVATSIFNVWKTIRLGTGLKTADDFRKDLKNKGFSIGDWANDILGKPAFTVAAEETEVDLVKVTVAGLGFRKGVRRDQIYKRAEELGLRRCPSEVGPQLRLQYRDQPNGEWIIIGMEPIIASDGNLSVFSVLRFDSELWLYGGWGRPDRVWDADSQWVFRLPRK